MALAARALGLQLRPFDVKTQADLEGALSALVTAGIDAVYVQPGTSITDPRRETLTILALRSRVPAVGAVRYYAEAGFLLRYGANQRAWPRRTAYFVDRLLRGVQPSDLPVEQPTEFELVVNMRTAGALGLPISASVLSRADEVIR
jgi:putative ABC transport system substrate-binding protein